MEHGMAACECHSRERQGGGARGARPHPTEMRTGHRVAASLTVVTLASLVMKLWSVALSDNEASVTRILEAAEESRVKADTDRSPNHVAYSLGLCRAARILMTDAEIERLTGVHMASYEERLNALMYQCTRSRRHARRVTTR